MPDEDWARAQKVLAETAGMPTDNIIEMRLMAGAPPTLDITYSIELTPEMWQRAQAEVARLGLDFGP